jgi:hypothetical protein
VFQKVWTNQSFAAGQRDILDQLGGAVQRQHGQLQPEGRRYGDRRSASGALNASALNLSTTPRQRRTDVL